MPEQERKPQPVAVIDIGSSAIRMVLAEIGPRGEIRPLENLSKPVLLGRDVFTTGRIGQQAMRESMDILSNFRKVLENYAVNKVHAVATSAVRDASNRDTFVDKVFIRTGIDIEVIEGIEENRLGLIAVDKALSGTKAFENKDAMVIEVGAGGTEIVITEKGKVELSRSIPIGSIRLPQQTVVNKSDPAETQRMLKRSLRTIIEDLNHEYSINKLDTFISIGGDMRLASRLAGGAQNGPYDELPKKDFLEFTKSISKLSADEIAAKLGIPYSDAETLYPSMVIYSTFLQETKAETLIIPMVSIRDGILLEISQMLSGYKRTDISRQVINSAKNLGKKYRYDETHAANVSANALRIFDSMQKEHGLGSQDRLLLEISALLHDIGVYVSPNSHHKHSMYLVEAADIFGLRKTHQDIVANVVRYHRRSSPKPTHVAYMSLPRAERTVVSKLAAMLRVADALDNSHQQKIKELKLDFTDEKYILAVEESAGDISLEKQSLADKSDMFTDIFGYPVALRQKSTLA